MAHLTLAGLSDDGKRLLLVSDEGVEFTLDVDARLRAALRGDHARLGQLEIQMDSALRPRDIQARIRAGETPETVAQAAQTTVDRIMPFAAPVLAERAARRAARPAASSVRRKPGEAARRAGRSATRSPATCAPLNVDPGCVEWDAWRREDGRWTLRATSRPAAAQGEADVHVRRPGQLRHRRGRGRPLADRRAEAATAAPDAPPASRRPPRPAGAGSPPYPPTSCRSARTPSSWSTSPPTTPAEIV